MTDKDPDDLFKTARELFRDIGKEIGKEFGGSRREYEYLRIPLPDGTAARVTFAKEKITRQDIEQVIRMLRTCSEGMVDAKSYLQRP